MTTTTNQLEALEANFGSYLPCNASYATLGNRTFSRCYSLGTDVWEENTDINPIREWTFTRKDGQFHARVKTTLAEAVRISEDWNADCPSRPVALVSGGGINRKIEITHQLCFA